MTTSENKPGPRPETLRAEGVDWKDAIKHALRKPKPKDGWPDKGECKHLNIRREVVGSQKTGECVCDDCGANFSYAEAAEIKARNKSK